MKFLHFLWVAGRAYLKAGESGKFSSIAIRHGVPFATISVTTGQEAVKESHQFTT